MWTTVSDSEHDHEREALAWLRSRLPDREPYHVWTNFEFTASNGRLYEVDALAITDNGFHLIEIKGYPGLIEGDGGTWQWTGPGGKFRQFDNPRILANRKAKVLKSLLESSPAFRNHRRDMPYLAECVFLSDPRLTVKLNRHGRDQIFGRDPDPGKDFPPERVAIGGIVDQLTSLDPDSNGRPRRRIQRPVVERLVKAVNQVGIRERTSRREVGDYLVGRLLDDVTADTTTGIAYQDFLGKHRSLETERRLRIYPLERNATAEQREAAQRAARREFHLLRPLDHPGIVRPVDYTDHERGPVLLFDYHPDEIGLAEYLASPEAERLTVSARLDMIRQIAEAVAFAARRGVHHRALAPSAVLVARRDGDETPATNEHEHDGDGTPDRQGDDPDAAPTVRVTNWHTGARVDHDGTSTLVTGTVHSHIEALAADDTDLYRAPEFHQDGARPAALDVFSLGALALHILTGQAPASSARRLRSALANTGYLDPASVADGVDPALADLVTGTTAVDPGHRPSNPDDFLEWLDLVETSWLHDVEEDNAVPIEEARNGHMLCNGRFNVLGRLGQGSTAFALLVTDATRHGRLVVLKVASDPEHNDRLLDEAAALDGLDHHSTIAWLEDDDPLTIDGRTVLVLRYAGPRRETDPARSKDRTLAARLAREPIGVELAQRWGRDLLDALRYLEQMGRAHRDIKPDNLGIATVGHNDELHLVLFDFSLSNAPLDAVDAGTPGYIDPFLIKRGRWDPAADRYSAAVVLLELTAGRKPTFGDDSVHPGYLDDPPPPDLSEDLFDPAVATGLVEFFTTALQPRAEDRYGTADEMERAWHRAFSAAEEPSTPSDHPDGDDDFVLPDGVGLSTGLAELPLSKRSVSSLERADVLTIEQLLAYPEAQLQSLRGVGAKTRGEIREALAVLRARFESAPPKNMTATGVAHLRAQARITASGSAPPTTVETREGPVDHGVAKPSTDDEPPPTGLRALALACLPKTTQKGPTSQELARIYAGLRADLDPWVTQSELAAALDVTAARVSQLTGAHRKRWTKQPAITELRHRLRAELERLRVASVDQLATQLVASSNDPADTVDSAEARAAARGLVRVATLTEESLAEPGWILRRRGGAALLAVQPTIDRTTDDGADDGAGPVATAQALADYAVSLAATTADLLADHEVLSRNQLVAALIDVARPPGVDALPPAHLADLAADLCDEAAVNARLELYRPGLEPLSALRASRRALLAPEKPLSPGDLATKVRARFPEAAALPDRPELDGLLAEAGTELEWRTDVEGGPGYLSPAHDLALTSAASSSVSRWGSDVPRPAIPEVEWDNAAEFEARLLDAQERGRSLVLLTEPRNLEAAAQQLARLVSATVSVDGLLVDRLHEITDGGVPSWETITSADAAGEAGPAWGRLQTVIDSAIDHFTERLLATEGSVLLTDAGLLARYDRLTRLATWRDAIETRSHPLQALWLLIPATGASEQPMLGNRAVPVTSRNQWAEIPADWLRGGDRVSKGTP